MSDLIDKHDPVQDCACVECDRLRNALATAIEERDGHEGNYKYMAKRAEDQQIEIERYGNALHILWNAADDSDGSQYGTLSTSFVRDIAKGQRGAACGASAAPTGCASNGTTEKEE